jgi:hypothetical protein
MEAAALKFRKMSGGSERRKWKRTTEVEANDGSGNEIAQNAAQRIDPARKDV